MHDVSVAHAKIAALEKQVATLRADLETQTTLLATILNGGLVELSLTRFDYAPVSVRPTAARTERRIIVDSNRELVERGQLLGIEGVQREMGKSVIAAVRYARESKAAAHRAEVLAADLAAIVRRLGARLGLTVAVADGRATATIDEDAIQSMSAAKYSFDAMVGAARDQMARDIRAGVDALTREAASRLRADLLDSLRQYAGRMLGPRENGSEADRG
jgi:hypothetical protein